MFNSKTNEKSWVFDSRVLICFGWDTHQSEDLTTVLDGTRITETHCCITFAKIIDDLCPLVEVMRY